MNTTQHKKAGTTDTYYDKVNLEKITMNERSQTEKSTYCMGHPNHFTVSD